ncbi:Glycosyl phosphatidyl inositol protein transamidase complex subunit [Entomortierella beljakovae]|nr:Glycosyl phosphatidyl inositol protein transamidase complex subunit [Entomortierella beljakovae]
MAPKFRLSKVKKRLILSRFVLNWMPALRRSEALKAEFTKIGLKSATQNYTLNTSTESRSGVNTYAVFYAPRSDGTEAIVLSAPWISRTSETNTNAISLLLTLAKVFKRGSHFSKDVIFVVSDGGAEGLQAWLKAYHGNEGKTDSHYEETLLVRSGAIQAALNLDFSGTGDYNALGIFFEGVNGQLPNLDMIYVIRQISEGNPRIELTLHDELVPYTENMTKNYINSLKKMLYMMKYQAAGIPTGNHGLYLKYKIDAITLYAFHKHGWSSTTFGLHRLGSSVESYVRSLNNLLEHLHQSFFFYLLSGVKSYTSIGLYMPPVIILGVSFIFRALSYWGLSGDLPLEYEAINDGKKIAIALPYSRRKRDIKASAVVIVMSFITGWASFLLLTTGLGFPGETPLLKLIASSGASIMLIMTGSYTVRIRSQILKKIRAKAKKPSTEENLEPAADWVMLKTFVMSLSALVVTTLSVLNFSLAVSIGVIIVLPYMLFRPSSYFIISALQAIALLTISPPGLLLAGSWWYSMDVGLILSWVLEGYEVVGSWLLPIVCCIYWPLNLAATIMVLLPVS